MPYIKSYSNYVLKKRHQSVSDGTIYERDITTIGGRDNFSKGQVPLYQSGNFVITVHNDNNIQKDTYSGGWVQNESGDTWTLATINEPIKDENTSSDEKIVLKQDYYNLRDFAYFGSCSELIRASISDILRKFPGELFVPYDNTLVYTYKFDDKQMELTDDGTTVEKNIIGLTAETTSLEEVKANNGYDCVVSKVGGIPVFYYDTYNFNGGSEGSSNNGNDGNSKTSIKRLGGESKFLVDNPFDIDIHTAHVKDSELSNDNFLKYFANDGYKNYEIIDNEGNHYDFTWSVKYFGNKEGKHVCEGDKIADITFTVLKRESVFSVSPTETKFENKEGVVDVSVSSEEIGVPFENFTIEAWIGDSNKVYYLIDLDENQSFIDDVVYSKTDNEKEFNIKRLSLGKLNIVVGETYTLSLRTNDDSFNKTFDAVAVGVNADNGWTTLTFDPSGSEIFYVKKKYDECYIDTEHADYSVNHLSITQKKANSSFKYRIRPKKQYMDSFENNLDVFEKILINGETNPKYTSTFNVIRENEFGYYTELERMTFPTTYGGYNLGGNGPAFDDYVSNLASIAEFYDERFCDNMYRSMTHESIKNFDWTYSKKRSDEDSDTINKSAEKVAKIIRLFGRQFDEILAYVDNIKNYNVVTYDNLNNLPDYFFSDTLDADGWDVKQIIPLSLFEYVGNKSEAVDISDKTTDDDEKSNEFDGKPIHRIFSNDTSLTVKPYSKSLDAFGDGYFFGCNCNAKETLTEKKFEFIKKKNVVGHDDKSVTVRVISKNEDVGYKSSNKYDYFESSEENQFNVEPTEVNGVKSSGDIITSYITSVNENVITSDTFVDCIGILRNRIKNYSSENEWTMSKVNTEFMKRLILSSSSIWRHKGTQDGVEMILGMFGMKSKRWYDSLPNYEKSTYAFNFGDNLHIKPYDYEIKEYTSFTKRIEDPYIEGLGDYKYDWFNKCKNISYGTDDYSNYQGIPVKFRETRDGKRYLYPNFQKNELYDGGIYYQMNGGWISTSPYLFNNENNIVVKKENSKIYEETLRNIRSVESLQELFDLPIQSLGNGDVIYVKDLSGNFAVVDGRVYPLEEEYDGENAYRYFTVDALNGSVIVGNAFFNEYVMVSDPYAVDHKRRYGLVGGENDGNKIKVYLIDRPNIQGKSIYAYSDTDSVSTFTVFENGQYMEGSNFSHYFRINDTLYSNELSVLGWEQLKTNDYDFYRVNTDRDYYNGNNPHSGNLRYDNGHEYFTYFRHLFKYAYNNSLFNESFLSDYPTYADDDIYSDIYDFGFKSLINDDNCQLDYDDFLTEDSKIHYFGNYYDEEGMHAYTISESVSDSEYNLSTINPKASTVQQVGDGTVGYGWMHKPCGGNDVEGSVPIDGVTNQIVNNKVVKVIFYIRDDNFYTKTAMEEIKYLESVVVPYMTQMMPSNAILGVEYRFAGQGVHSYTVKTNVNGEPIDGLGVEVFNVITNQWEFIGYTEQGILTFEVEGDMESVNVRINGGNSENANIELSDYYFSTEFYETPLSVDVSTMYSKVAFDTSEGSVQADGCLEFNGTLKTNPEGKYYTYSVEYENGDGWIDIDDGIYSSTLSEQGGTFGFGVSRNDTLEDRTAKIIFVYKPSDTMQEVRKELLVHQYSNNEYITYTVISNANDKVRYQFKNPTTNEVEKEGFFKNGIAEYSKPKVSATTMTVVISGGLPSDNTSYTLDTSDGSRSDTIDKSGETDWAPSLVFKKILEQYTWDDAVNVNERVKKDSISFTIAPDETIEKNYNIMEAHEEGNNGVHCLVYKPSVSWATISNKDENGKRFLNIANNKDNNDRETTVRYYIQEDPSVFLDYKIRQIEGVYTFVFNKKDDNITILDTSKKRAKVRTSYSKHTFDFSLDYISSYSNSVENNVSFIVSVNDKNVTYTIDNKFLHLNVEKNTCTLSKSFTVTFVQTGSNKRLILTVEQSEVICDVGDVYCYNPSNGVYYFADVLNGDTIEKSWIPIGITIIPMDNGLNGNGQFARVISLVEKNNDEYHDAVWRKTDGDGSTQKNDFRWSIGCLDNNLETWYASIGTEPYQGFGVMKYNHLNFDNGLYYADTTNYAQKLMSRDSNGHYKVAKDFVDDKAVYQTSTYVWKSCLCDFNGFAKTRRGASLKKIGALYKMCDDYETSGTKKGEWFLGGGGEMACLVQNIGKINAVINKLMELHYVVTKLHVSYQPDKASFRANQNGGSYLIDYYWTITNKGRVGGYNSEDGGNPNSGDEYASWVVLLSNGTMQWATHRAGTNQSSARNQVRARVRPMLLVDKENNHVYDYSK